MTKAIFFDVDGTLISFKTHQISPAVRQALQALRERGIPVDEDITTVEEARDAILALWKKAKGTGCCGEDKTC